MPDVETFQTSEEIIGKIKGMIAVQRYTTVMGIPQSSAIDCIMTHVSSANGG